MKINELSDTEVAILTYAMENFCDNIQENNWIKSFENEALHILSKINKEYSLRKLNCNNYYAYTVPIRFE